MNARCGKRWICALAMIVAFAPPPAAAGGAPKWLHALVDVAAPAHDDKTGAVVLYADTELTVERDGKSQLLERKAYRILRPEGAARGRLQLLTNPASRITDVHAWCIPKSGKDYEVKERDAIETSMDARSGILVSDNRALMLQIPEAVPGSVIGYEISRELSSELLEKRWVFQDSIPVREAHLILRLPSGWSYGSSWAKHREIAPVASGAGQWEWTVSDLPGIHIEPFMKPWSAEAGRLFLTLIPPTASGRAVQTWDDLGVRYARMSQGRREASPELAQKVRDLTASAPDLPAKIRALAAFAQNDIRYVAIELGAGGYVPHPAAEVFMNRYGDCKDKATLLSAMLTQIGIKSYYVVINAARGFVSDNTPPSLLAFNHVILAMALPADAGFEGLTSTLAHPKLGKLLFFDPTDWLTPWGSLRGDLQGNYGMLVTPEGGELVQLPQSPPAANGVTRSASLVLDEQGTLRGNVTESHLGDRALRERMAIRAVTEETDRIKPVESELAGSLSAFQITQASIANLRVEEKPFEWHYSLEAAQYAKTAADLLLVRPRVVGSYTRTFLETAEPRVHAVEFDAPERDTDTFEIALPPGYDVDSLPPAVDVDDGFAAYHSKTECVGQTLRYTRTFEISTLSIPASRAVELKNLYRSIATDERALAVFKKRATP